MSVLTMLRHDGPQENGRAGNMPARCRRLWVTYAVGARGARNLITGGSDMAITKCSRKMSLGRGNAKGPHNPRVGLCARL